MANNKKRTVELTPEEITAWAHSVSGASQANIAKTMNKGQTTVSRWIKKARKAIGEDVEIENFRTPLYGLYPLAVASLMHNLKENFDRVLPIVQALLTNDVNVALTHK